MNRRDAIARVGLLFGGTVIGADVFLSGCARRPEETLQTLDFSGETIRFLDEVGEIILPATASSPGAKEAKIGEFMKAIVSDCYEPKDQTIFLEGMDALQKRAEQAYSKGFMKMSAEDRHQLIVEVDAEAKEYQSSKKVDDPTHYFIMMKQLTLWGYFTSEVGSTKALRYLPVPGRYEGCVPYTKGEGSWSAI